MRSNEAHSTGDTLRVSQLDKTELTPLAPELFVPLPEDWSCKGQKEICPLSGLHPAKKMWLGHVTLFSCTPMEKRGTQDQVMQHAAVNPPVVRPILRIS